MATIKLTNTCQGSDIELRTHEMSAERTVVNDSDAGLVIYGLYSYICPDCGQKESKPAEERTMDLIVAAGVHLTEVTIDLLEERNSFDSESRSLTDEL